MITLKAILKTKTNDQLRAEGFIPAVYYGAGIPSTAVAVNEIEFMKAYRETGETGTISIKTDKESVSTLIHAIQKDPVRGVPLHVDFLVVDMKKPIEVDIPVEFIGTAEAEKGGLGVVVKTLHEITVRALPDNLPHDVTVDVTSLSSIDSTILAGDIALPNGVELVTDASEVVASVTAYAAEEAAEPVAIDLSAIEVEKKGKKEDEETTA
jgi:large subunit ribosomal protein L25